MLRNFLKKHGARYDLIVIDCPPTESMATQAAYLASNYVLIPIKPEFLATIGLPLLATSLNTFHETYDYHKIDVAGIVFNDVIDSYENARAKDDVKELAKEHGWYVFKGEVSHSRSYPRGPREQTSIIRTKGAHWDKKGEFTKFALEFADRVGLRLPASIS